jgi:hypothetical protein
MGRLCKKLNRLDEAVQHFTAAQDLNPKDNAVRAALERLTEPDLPEGESLLFDLPINFYQYEVIKYYVVCWAH